MIYNRGNMIIRLKEIQIFLADSKDRRNIGRGRMKLRTLIKELEKPRPGFKK